jgi:hypothetical protein
MNKTFGIEKYNLIFCLWDKGRGKLLKNLMALIFAQDVEASD